MVKRWYADFKCDCTNTNDAERSGCPNSTVVLENTKKFHKLVLADHKSKLRETAEELKISEGSVFTILHEHFLMRKLSSKWVLRLLTLDQKQQCIDVSERCLRLFQCNKKEFLCKYVTTDETWIHHFTLESNQQSAEWTAVGESHPKQHKHQQARFWDTRGILFIDYLEKGRTLNNEYYKALLVCLKEEIAIKWPQMLEKKVLFYQDNAPCHKAIATMAKLHELHVELLLHLPYSQDLAFCKFQRNAQGKEIWLQWRNDILNWGVFWGQRQIVLEKKGIELLEKH